MHKLNNFFFVDNIPKGVGNVIIMKRNTNIILSQNHFVLQFLSSNIDVHMLTYYCWASMLGKHYPNSNHLDLDLKSWHYM